MEIRILLDTSDPPQGQALLEGTGAIAFVGWLGLLSALEALAVASPEAASYPSERARRE